MSRTLIICDIDGVLADCSHRLHYLEEKNYETFYSNNAMLDDKVIQDGLSLLFSLRYGSWSAGEPVRAENPVIFLTGRPARTRSITRTWIQHYVGYAMYTLPLLMRGDGDYRPSPVVKTELLQAALPDRGKKYDKIYFIDDDPENVKAVCEAFPKITGITFGAKRFK